MSKTSDIVILHVFPFTIAFSYHINFYIPISFIVIIHLIWLWFLLFLSLLDKKYVFLFIMIQCNYPPGTFKPNYGVWKVFSFDHVWFKHIIVKTFLDLNIYFFAANKLWGQYQAGHHTILWLQTIAKLNEDHVRLEKLYFSHKRYISCETANL